MSISETLLRRDAARTDAPAAHKCPTLFVYTPSAEPCGVETFTRTLLGSLDDTGGGFAGLCLTGRWSDFPAAARDVMHADRVIFNFPLVAWKRIVVLPLLLLVVALLAGRRVSVFLHEWKALHGLRRAAIAPFLLFCDSIFVVSPYIREQLAATSLFGRRLVKVFLLPHPPTIRRPERLAITDRVLGLAQRARGYDLVIGNFGSIYRGKSSSELLDICADLNRRKIRALLVYVGSFTHSLDKYESEFRQAVRARGLDQHVVVTGYVEDEAELFALFEQIGVFLFLFPEGLTARRSSVIACLQSDRRVVVSEPRSPHEFDHHAGWQDVIRNGGLVFVPSGATPETIGDLLVAASRDRVTAPLVDTAAWWRAMTDETRRAVG